MPPEFEVLLLGGHLRVWAAGSRRHRLSEAPTRGHGGGFTTALVLGLGSRTAHVRRRCSVPPAGSQPPPAAFGSSSSIRWVMSKGASTSTRNSDAADVSSRTSAVGEFDQHLAEHDVVDLREVQQAHALRDGPATEPVTGRLGPSLRFGRYRRNAAR